MSDLTGSFNLDYYHGNAYPFYCTRCGGTFYGTHYCTAPTYTVPQPTYYYYPAAPAPLSDEDIDKIAKRVVEILSERLRPET